MLVLVLVVMFVFDVVMLTVRLLLLFMVVLFDLLNMLFGVVSGGMVMVNAIISDTNVIGNVLLVVYVMFGFGCHNLDINNVLVFFALLEKVMGGNFFVVEVYFVMLCEFS